MNAPQPRPRKYGNPDPRHTQTPAAYGFDPDPQGHRVTPAFRMLQAAMKQRLTGPMPSQASLKDALEAGPGILFQLGLSACVGFGIVGALETYVAGLRLRGQPVPAFFENLIQTPGSPALSPLSVYDVARAVDREPFADGSLPAFEDRGSQPNQAYRGIAEWGICPYAARPTVEGAVNREPSLSELQQGMTNLIQGPRAIVGSMNQRVQQLAAALAAGIPVSAGSEVTEAFEDFSGGDAIPAPGPADYTFGGHYFYFVGFRTLGNGDYEFEIANSWSPQWGEGGYGRVTQMFAAQTSALYLANLVV